MADIERLKAARLAVHDLSCPSKRPGPCMACPSGNGLDAALAVLDAKPGDAAGARLALHDAVCRSEFCDGADHAKRTQSAKVAALRKWHRSQR